MRRREFLKVASGGAALTVGGVLPGRAMAQRRTLKVGYVSPQTGPLAGFGESDAFVVAGVRKAAPNLSIKGQNLPVEIIVRDSQSDPNRAAEVASRLILSDKIDLMLVASTPETTNPVSDQCEVNGTPCVSSVCPWQPWFFARGGKPDTGFKSTYHFFWGLEDIIGVFLDMWGSIPTNKVVGALWPNDGDGNAWGDKERGFPPALAKAGYTLVDPGRYPNLSDDFSAQISAFKNAKVEIVTGVPIPPDWTTFWKQAAQQGFKPKIASVGKALLFPRSVEALGPLGTGMSTEVWWSPQHPFKSSLTGATAGQLAAAYTTETKKQWTQPLGFVHALFEVGFDQGHQPQHDRRADQLGQGPGAQRHQDPARRRPVGEGQGLPLRRGDRQQQVGAEHPDGRDAEAARVGGDDPPAVTSCRHCWRSTAFSNPSARSSSSTGSVWPSRRARRSASSVLTARARPPRSTS
jgi:branched-chain amino acid transport system substrate-binding protein